jgi:hypothetical protein
VKGYLDLAAAFFALAAAIFWFLSAYGKLPLMKAYVDHVPPYDPYRMRSAWLNSIAATLSGCSALCAFFSYLAGPPGP